MNPRVVGVLLIAATACSENDKTSANSARHNADQFISEQYSITNISMLKVTENETPTSWEFIYEAPNENWTGGPLLVTVDRKTGKIINHRGYQ
jgi:hypothetical protein